MSFVFDGPATTEIYTLSLHDALPILLAEHQGIGCHFSVDVRPRRRRADARQQARQHGFLLLGAQQRRDRKSTRLNSSHPSISYAVFCLKKKKKNTRVLWCNCLARDL